MDAKRLAKAVGILVAVVVAIVLLNALILFLFKTGLLAYVVIGAFLALAVTLIYHEFT